MASPLLEHIRIFCDGACSGNPGPGGWGAIVATPLGDAWELGGGLPATTNNQMELLAATEGLISVADVGGPVHVLTDSVYVIKGITQWIWGWRRKGWTSATGEPVMNRDFWERLSRVVQERGKENPITWRYVRGHTGNPGNERCDEIAVAFAKRTRIDLFRGRMDRYLVDIYDVPSDTSVPERTSASGSGKKAAAHSYLSLLDGTPQRHTTWSECERRVKGRSNAKFKKAASASDETAILKSWGVDPGDLK